MHTLHTNSKANMSVMWLELINENRKREVITLFSSDAMTKSMGTENSLTMGCFVVMTSTPSLLFSFVGKT